MKPSLRIAPLGACGVLSLLCLPTLGQASGFAIPEISIAGIGLSNALVANPSDIGAIPYNPAAAAFHPGTTLSGGLLLLRPHLEVSTDTTHESQGADNVLAPMLQASYQVNDDLTLGLGVSAPFGLETRWPDGTFPALASYDPDGPNGLGPAPTYGYIQPGALQSTHSKLEVVQVSPTLAMRLSPQAALSVGLDYLRVRQVVFSSRDASNEGSGDGWGWNAAFLYNRGPWSLGASYHAKAGIDVEGSSSLTTAAGTSTAVATATVPLPWRAQLGLRYQASRQLALEFDITRTGWSEFDQLTIQGVSTTVSTNNWDDANAYRLGGTYQLSPATQLRFGYSFDATGQPDAYFSARIPDADRQLFSIGLGQDLGNGLLLEAGYSYVHFQNRNYQGASAYPAAPSGSVDPNGTDAYNGSYKADVHLLGIGLSKRF